MKNFIEIEKQLVERGLPIYADENISKSQSPSISFSKTQVVYNIATNQWFIHTL